MNALIKKAAARRQQKASSASADKGKAAAVEVSREEVPVVTITEVQEAPLSSSRKRRAPGTPGPQGQSTSSGELGPIQTDAVSLRQIRPDHHSRVLCCRSNLYDMYREDLRIVGTGPSPLAGAVLRDVASTADADFLHGLSWSDLVMRSNSATAEAALLNAEVTFQATNLQKQSSKDAWTFEATSAELKQKLADLTLTLEKEVANAKRREDDIRQGFVAETLKLKNELRVVEVRLEASQNETRAAQEELSLAQQVAASAQADLVKGSEVFKEAFLKSEEFGEIIGDKALGFLEVGFNGCVAQFKAAGYPPEGTLAEFISFNQILENLPPDLPINPRAMVISDQSAALNLAGQNSPHVFAGEGMQNGELIQQAGSITIHSKQLQDDLQGLGQKIKHNEDNIKYLKTQKTKLEESILDMTATLEKYHKTSFSATQNQFLDLSKSEEETLGNILKHEKSAAALLCMIKSQPESQASDHTSTKDVLGIVATLGKVEDDNLSRLLSEYLGLETMLAVVCKTYEGVNALEAYNKEGSINKSLGLHALATSTRRSLDDPFLVICLETLRPYPGKFIANDPQRRLDLLKPRIINGETPPGFLGFAVNMINIDRSHLYYITKSGFGLRETLFYNLLSRLQVYKSREDMLKALPYIPDGAISLDGGMIKSPGVFRLAPPREDVKFPVGFERLSLPEKFLEIENQIKETKWKKDRIAEDLLREQSYLDHAKVNYEMKKQEFLKFLAESSMYTAQVARGSAAP